MNLYCATLVLILRNELFEFENLKKIRFVNNDNFVFWICNIAIIKPTLRSEGSHFSMIKIVFINYVYIPNSFLPRRTVFTVE